MSVLLSKKCGAAKHPDAMTTAAAISSKECQCRHVTSLFVLRLSFVLLITLSTFLTLTSIVQSFSHRLRFYPDLGDDDSSVFGEHDNDRKITTVTMTSSSVFGEQEPFFSDNNDTSISMHSHNITIPLLSSPTRSIHHENASVLRHNDSDPTAPLNILILYPDDWRHDSIEDEQPSIVHTPFLSRLAKQGIRFTHNAVTSSICWLSRATLFTGQYVSRHQAERLFCPTFTSPEQWQHTWPARLQKERNFFIGHIGKWQYGNGRRFFSNVFNWSSIHEGRHWQQPTKYFENLKKEFEIRYQERRGMKNETIPAADLAKEEAIFFLKHVRPKDQPFALTVAFYPPKPVGESREPGGQWDPPQKYLRYYENITIPRPYNFSQAYEALPPIFRMSQNRFYQRWRSDEHFQVGMKRYFALISNVDDACRQIVDELKRQGLLEKTMIIFTTDNGMMLGHHGLAGKWHPYEESIRVPLIIYDPRVPKEDRGTLNHEFTLNIDLAETILGAAKLEPSPFMQGRDIADLYLGHKHGADEEDNNRNREPWRQDFFYDFPLGDMVASSSLVTKQYKYLKFRRNNVIEQLFDLQKDPYELHNLMNEIPSEILHQLKKRYEQVKQEATNNDGLNVTKCEKRIYA